MFMVSTLCLFYCRDIQKLTLTGVQAKGEYTTRGPASYRLLEAL